MLLFTGIFAILRSVECRDAIARGQAELAAIKSREARRLSHVTLGVGLGMSALVIALTVVYVVVLVAAHH